ncbi:MAG: P2 family phage major capsid protein, partial [Alphaproteobacteria bacterium]|nr:P2 family phage major capsid protein [Alphaproteobacteria bacterium]
MRNETRVAFNAYLAHVATLNGVATPTQKFNVAPSIEQVLEDRIREQAEFLGQVNIQPVGQQTGEKLGLGIGSPVAGRTNTTTADRTPRNVAAFDNQGYACVQTNFDTFVRYEQLDAWAKFPDFQTRLRNQITQQVGRDRLMIGWHGETAAQTTDL